MRAKPICPVEDVPPALDLEQCRIRVGKLVEHIFPTFADPINKQQMFQHLPYLGETVTTSPMK
jgi:hypothetical protein